MTAPRYKGALTGQPSSDKCDPHGRKERVEQGDNGNGNNGAVEPVGKHETAE